MQAISQTSPYVRKATSTKRMMVDVLIALIPVIAFAIFQFKFDFVLRAVVAVVVALLVEAVAFGLMKEKNETLKDRFKKFTVNNIAPPIITALIFVLTLPSTISIYVVIVGILFAMIVGKMIFGGLGKNIFNPAGLGRAFVALSFASFFAYTNVDATSGATALGGSFTEMLTAYSFSDLFFGLIPGSMGEISALAIIIGAIYLVVRRAADWRVIVSSLLAFSLFMFVAALGKGFNFGDTTKFVLFQVLTGGFLFGIVFMATDPVTSPFTAPGRLIFGLIIGGLVAIIRLFGSLPEGMVFALLIANAFVGLIDYKRWTNSVFTKRYIIIYSAVVLVIALCVFAGVGGFAS